MSAPARNLTPSFDALLRGIGATRELLARLAVAPPPSAPLKPWPGTSVASPAHWAGLASLRLDQRAVALRALQRQDPNRQIEPGGWAMQIEAVREHYRDALAVAAALESAEKADANVR
jgi:hypothetical protein